MKFTVEKAPEFALTKATRSGTSLGFPWSTLKPGECFFVPHKFWLEERKVPASKFDVEGSIQKIKSSLLSYKKAEMEETKWPLYRVICTEAEKDGEKGLYVTRMTGLGEVDEPKAEEKPATEEPKAAA